MWLFTSRLHIFFSDAIDHWMFWQRPNLSFFRQIWRKNQQSPVIYSVSIWHDLHTYIDRHEVYIHIYIYITYTRSKQKESDRKETHGKKKYIEPNQDEETMDNQTWHCDCVIRLHMTHQHSVPCVHMNTPAAYHVYTSTHQQRTMCTHEHTSSVPCVHINTPAAYHVYTSTHQQRTMCTHEHQRWHTPPHPTPRTMCTHQHTSSVPCVHMNTPAAHHVYTSTHQQRTMCTHQHTSCVPCVHMNTNVDTPHPTPRTMCTHQHTSSVPCVHMNTNVDTPHPTPPHMLKFRANPPGRPNMLHNVSKVVLCGRRKAFATFSEDVFQFSWQAQHFGDLYRYVAWQAQHFRHVVWCVFLRIALSGLREVVTTCKFRGRRGILWEPRTKHRFCGRKFWGSWENSRENGNFAATKCENRRKSRTKCSCETCPFRGHQSWL